MEDGFLKKFLDETKGLSYTERGEHLEKAQGIIDTHMESAQEGQTEVLGGFVNRKWYDYLLNRNITNMFSSFRRQLKI